MKRLWWKLFGEWVVIYHDGQRSMAMSYGVAKDYAAIFGGSVEPTYFFELSGGEGDDSHLT